VGVSAWLATAQCVAAAYCVAPAQHVAHAWLAYYVVTWFSFDVFNTLTTFDSFLVDLCMSVISTIYDDTRRFISPRNVMEPRCF
jgi:hypothetical protein